MSPRTVVLAGGGTGGHVFPLVAVARALVAIDPGIHPVFVGTPRGMEVRFVPEQGFDLELLDVLPLRGGGPLGFLRGTMRALSQLPRGRALIERLGAVGVLSVGGYAAGPVSLAARTLGLPVGLLEPNSVIGLSNRLLAPFVQRAYTAFEVAEPAFDPAVVRPLGVPIRPDFTPRPYQLDAAAPRVLVLGGSQGALSLNRVLPGALAAVRRRVPGLSVVHQCGAAHVEAVRGTYAEHGADFVTVTPFIEDMATALARADLVVGRSGAGAVSEITAIGRPSLLIPYPHASGDHQRHNAQVLERRGAALCLVASEVDAARLERELAGLLSDTARLGRMAEAARAFGRPHAAADVAADFLELIETTSSVAPRAGGSERRRAEAATGNPLRLAEVA